VVGLRKAKTREERLEAMRRMPNDERLPLASKMYREERERLLGPVRMNKK